MTFNVLTLGLLIIVPMIAALAVQLLTQRFVGKALSIVLGIAALLGTGWAILTFGFGAEVGAGLVVRAA